MPKDFAPQGDKVPKNALEVSLVNSAPAMNQQPVPAKGSASGAPPVPQQRAAQLSPAQMPRGAKQVQIAGVSPALGQAAPPATMRQATQTSDAVDVYSVAMEGIGPDGRKFRAVQDYEFPKGTKITTLGVVD